MPSTIFCICSWNCISEGKQLKDDFFWSGKLCRSSLTSVLWGKQHLKILKYLLFHSTGFCGSNYIAIWWWLKKLHFVCNVWDSIFSLSLLDFNYYITYILNNNLLSTYYFRHCAKEFITLSYFNLTTILSCTMSILLDRW